MHAWHRQASILLAFATVACGFNAALHPAAALTINIVAGPGLATNGSALAAFNRAAQAWQTTFSDPITVTINADLQNMGSPTILGSTSSVLLQAGYDVIRNQMVADADADDGVLAHTPTAAQFTAFIPTGFSLSGIMLATKADLKAMGFAGLDGLFGTSDATVTFNSGFSFDYDNSNGVASGTYDFESVATHEIGHVLGFDSIVDTIDSEAAASTPGAVPVMPLDVFRFGPFDDPATLADFTTATRDLVPGHADFFDDIDQERLMSTGVNFGDGNQASHWKADELTGTFVGIMDPTLASGVAEGISPADARALDLIGWDRLNATAPEPVSGAIFLVGIAIVGVLRRKSVSA